LIELPQKRVEISDCGIYENYIPKHIREKPPPKVVEWEFYLEPFDIKSQILEVAYNIKGDRKNLTVYDGYPNIDE
jgi:hypothetical protein